MTNGNDGPAAACFAVIETGHYHENISAFYLSPRVGREDIKKKKKHVRVFIGRRQCRE